MEHLFQHFQYFVFNVVWYARPYHSSKRCFSRGTEATDYTDFLILDEDRSSDFPQRESLNAVPSASPFQERHRQTDHPWTRWSRRTQQRHCIFQSRVVPDCRGIEECSRGELWIRIAVWRWADSGRCEPSRCVRHWTQETGDCLWEGGRTATVDRRTPTSPSADRCPSVERWRRWSSSFPSSSHHHRTSSLWATDTTDDYNTIIPNYAWDEHVRSAEAVRHGAALHWPRIQHSARPLPKIQKQHQQQHQRELIGQYLSIGGFHKRPRWTHTHSKRTQAHGYCHW